MKTGIPKNRPTFALGRGGRAGRHEPDRRKRVVRWLVVPGALALAFYAYVSSSFFFAHWIQPRVERALGHPLRIDSVDFSPWGRVVLKNVEMENLPGEQVPRLKIAGVDIRFDTLAFLRHRVRVSRLHVDSPSIRITRDADGTLKGPFLATAPPGAKPESDRSDKSDRSDASDKSKKHDATTPTLAFDWAVEVNDFRLTALSATVESYEKRWAEPRSVTLDSFSLECPRLVLGEEWQLKGTGKIKTFLPEQAKGNSPSGDVSIDVRSAPPESGAAPGLRAEARLTNVRGSYRGRKLARPVAVVVLTPRFPAPGRIELPASPVKIVAGDRTRLRANVSGQWDLATQAGWVRAALLPMDPNILELMAPAGPAVPTGGTRVSGKARLTVAPGGVPDTLEVEGRLENLSSDQSDQSDKPGESETSTPSTKSTPSTEFALPDLSDESELAAATGPAANADFSFRFTFGRAGQPPVLQGFELSVAEADGKKVAMGKLTKPLELDAKTHLPVAGRVGPDALTLTVDSLDLSEWGRFVPAASANIRGGVVTGRFDVGEDPRAKGTVRLSATLDAANLRGGLSGKAFGPLSVKSRLRAAVAGDRRLDLQEFTARLTSGEKALGMCRLKGALGFQPLDGNLDVELENLQLVNVPAGLYRRFGVEIRNGYINGTVAARFSPSPSRIDLDSNLNVGDLALADPAGRGDPIDGVRLTASGRVALVRGAGGISRLEADSVGVSARRAQRALVTLSARGNLDLEKNQGRVEVDCVDCDLVPFLRFQGTAPRDALPLESVLNAHVQVDSAPGGTLVGVGRLELKPLVFRAFGASAAPGVGATPGGGPKTESVALPLKAKFKQTIDPKARDLKIEEFLVNVGGTEGEGGSLEATGRVNYAGPIAADLELRAKALRLLPFVAFQPSLARRANLTDAVADGGQTVAFAAKGPTLSAKGTLRIEGVRPPVSTAGAAPAAATLAIAVSDQVSYKDARLSIEETRIDLIHSGGRTDRIDIKGRPAQKSGEAAGFEVASKAIDLQALAPYAGTNPAEGAPALVAEDLAFRVVPSPDRFDVRGFSARLAGGKIQCDSVAIGKGPAAGEGPSRIEWKGATGENLNAATLMANFAPEKAGRLIGTAEFQTSGAAQGFDKESMRRALRATFHSRLRDGELKEIPLLEELASVTGIPDLRRAAFSRFETDAAATDKGIEVRTVDIEGELQKIHAQGRVAYGGKIDLPLTLALGGALKERVARQKYAQYLQTDKAGYLVFPTPLKVSGTLSKPKIRLEFPTESLIDVGLGILNQQLQQKTDKKHRR